MWFVVYMAEYDQAHFLFWLFFPERMMQIYQVSCLQVVGGFLVWCQLGCVQASRFFLASPLNDLIRSLMDSLFADCNSLL